MFTDDHVDTLIANLKVLASVPDGGRLCIRKGRLSVEPVVHGQAVSRFVHGDSRDTTISHVRNSIAGTIHVAHTLMEAGAGALGWKEAWTLDRIAAEMERAEAGMRNLRTTYAADTSTTSALQVLSERLAAHHAQIEAFLGRTRAPATPR